MSTFKRKKKVQSGGGVIPPNLLIEEHIPKFYHDALVLCGVQKSNGCPDTALVKKLMMTSQLSHDTLVDIWSMCSRSIPGTLTRQEFFACLALIALEQRGETLSHLCDVSTLPIPSFQSFTINTLKQKSGNSFPFDTSNGSIVENPLNSSFESPSSLHVDKYSIGSSKKANGELTRITIWRNCLEAALLVFTKATNILLDSDLEYSLEVLQTEKGMIYIQCLQAVYTVTQRINNSLNRIPGSAERQELEDLHTALLAKWLAIQKIALAFEKTNVRDHRCSSTGNCSICLRSTDDEEFITFDQKTYHAKCANFFLNHVGSQLPY